MGIDAKPILAKAYQWHKANPQYEIGHRVLVDEIDQLVAMHPGLHLIGAAYLGSGIPDCIQSGMTAALEITRRQANTLRHLAPEVEPEAVAS
jgi:oxygen-dependent protoporphyrinogen oxidase